MSLFGNQRKDLYISNKFECDMKQNIKIAPQIKKILLEHSLTHEIV